VDRQTRQYTEERVVTIREVSMTNNYVMVRDQFGTNLRISMQFHGTITAVPHIGERWVAQRRGMEWFLDRRADSGEEATAVTDLQPGDRRISAPNGRVLIEGAQVLVNGQPPGSTVALNNVVVGQEPTLNFIPAANTSITIVDDTANHRLNITIGDGVPLGSTFPFSGTVAPTNYIFARGQMLDAVANPAYMPLYNTMGTTHGGTGPSNFGVPDIQGRVVTGQSGVGGNSEVTTIGATEGQILSLRKMRHGHGHNLSISGGSHAHGDTIGFTDTGHGHGGSSTDSQGNHNHGYNSATLAFGGTFGGSSNLIYNIGYLSIATSDAGAHAHNVFVGTGSANLSKSGGVQSNTHTHATGEFIGAIGQFWGGTATDTSGFIVLPYIIKIL
jgi:hypothetical protein